VRAIVTTMRPEQSPADDDDVPGVGEAEARRIGATLRLGQALAADTDDGHLSLAALEAVAATRGVESQGHGLPRHLTRCPTCLDLYEALLAGVPAVSGASRTRFLRVGTGAVPPRTVGVRGPFLRALAAAACIAVLLTAGFRLRHLVDPRPPRAVGGSCRLAEGGAIDLTQGIPARRKIVVAAGTSLRLDDGGTAVRAEGDASISFTRSLAGHPVFHLHAGAVHVTAARQRPGMSVHVKTALGDVTVIGTEFRVTVGSEPIVIHEVRPDAPQAAAYEDRVATVAVAVTEGTVAVSTTRDRRLVTAGQTAVLRQGQPLVEVQ
jgi:hypothetical protein